MAVLGAYGVLDELLQIPVGRIASIADWGADLLGIMLGVGLEAFLAFPIERQSDDDSQ